MSAKKRKAQAKQPPTRPLKKLSDLRFLEVTVFLEIPKDLSDDLEYEVCNWVCDTLEVNAHQISDIDSVCRIRHWSTPDIDKFDELRDDWIEQELRKISPEEFYEQMLDSARESGGFFGDTWPEFFGWRAAQDKRARDFLAAFPNKVVEKVQPVSD